MRRTDADVLIAYSVLVPSMETNFGSPSYWTSSFASERLTAVVCGICASRTASSASSVPGTLARTSPTSDSGEIFAKDAGSASGGTYAQLEPSSFRLLNQRPESSA